MQLLTDQESYKTYMNGLATSHVDLNWFKFGDEQAIRTGGQSAIQGLGLWADEEKPVGIDGARHDNFMAQHEASIVIMTPQREKIQDQQTDYSACESIVRDIVSKLIADYQAGVINTKIDRYKWGEVVHSFGGSKYTGCRLDLHWEESADLILNPAKWQ